MAQMTQAIDWATSMTRQSGNALFGHIDVSRIAIAGHSCGGLQALKVSADPRISTSMIFDSGIYVKPGGRSGVKIDKGALASLHGPIAYFTGGPTDIAHPNTVDDVARINHVPVFFGWLPVGHGGTFAASDGGDWATAAVRWMDWQLKGDAEAGRWFSGATCLFCQDSRWKVERFVAVSL